MGINAKDRRGFTLVEIAIVFAIAGGVIGAIFVAASTASKRVRLNQGVDEISQIVINMRSLYAGQNASAATTIAFSAAAETVFVQQGVFPKEMLRKPTNIYADNPWDSSAAFGSALVSVNSPVTTPSQFVVEYQNVAADDCAELLVRNSVPGTETGLQQINIGTTICKAGNTCSLPVTPIAAAAACPVGAVYTIDWHYTLGS